MRGKTNQLLKQMVSPLCGINQHIGLIYRGRHEARIFTAGVDLTGVHVLKNMKAPKRGAYHIGGSGIFLDEAIIRALSESLERYSQLLAENVNPLPTMFANYHEMSQLGEEMILPQKMILFSSEQFRRKQFPFVPFNVETPFTWIKATSLFSLKQTWVPMQLLFVGYSIKQTAGEQWLNSAVTTGTASHVNHVLSIRNALLELIQIDAAMGHWYTSSSSYEIILDNRTQIIKSLIKKYAVKIKPKFYWLPSPDLTGIAIACVIEKKVKPYIAVGLGIDMSLNSAMYKAFLEALGVMQLAKVNLIEEQLHGDNDRIFDSNAIFDLDNNVGYYAKRKNYHRIQERFFNSGRIHASELPFDDLTSPEMQVKLLINSFKESDKELFYIDITTPEAHELGFVITRVWSPDTLQLSLPSAVPALHPRFKQYGGIKHDDPHPYP